MKDERTHLAYKAEHAVDLETEVIVAAQVTQADRGDARTGPILALHRCLYLRDCLFWSIIGGIVYVMFKQKHHLAERELSVEEVES